MISDAPARPSFRKPNGFPHAVGQAGRSGHSAIPERRRLTYALLLSLLLHAWLFTLTFGGQGLPHFGLPWGNLRIDSPDLRVALAPTQVVVVEPAATPVAEPLPLAPVEQPVLHRPAPARSFSRAPAKVRLESPVVPEANPETAADPKTETNPKSDARSSAAAAARAATATADLRPVQPRDNARPPPPLIAVDRIEEDTWVVPATRTMSSPVVVTAPSAASPPSAIPPPALISMNRLDKDTWVVPATGTMSPPAIVTAPKASSPASAMPSSPDAGDAPRARLDQVAKAAVELTRVDPSRHEEQQAKLAAAQQEAARQEAALEQAARTEVARREAERQEAAQREAALQEQARQQAERQEAARIEAARQAAAVQEAAQQEAAHQEAARQEALRQEAAKQEAARQEAERQQVAQREAARQEAEARREARLRAIGRQLDEEAARREANAASAGGSSSLPPPWNLRRYRLFGRTDPHEDIIRYAEAWERKLQLNTAFEMVRELAQQPHADPLVTVAVRSDGSVESVTFVQSSGVAAIDDAIRRIVDSQKPYPMFPPNLAREYDVIEIRRTWYFDMAIRLY